MASKRCVPPSETENPKRARVVAPGQRSRNLVLEFNRPVSRVQVDAMQRLADAGGSGAKVVELHGDRWLTVRHRKATRTWRWGTATAALEKTFDESYKWRNLKDARHMGRWR